MKYILICLLFCVVFCGCISKEDQLRLNRMTAEEREKVEALIAERVKAYLLIETQTREVKEKIKEGSLSIDDGGKYIALLRSEMEATVEKVEKQIEDTKDTYREEERRLLESGASKVEYYLGIGVSILASFFGVNAYRSRKHPLTKELA